MRKKNILVLTQWSFKDALVQAYTMPYVNIIADKIPEGSAIFLVTFEQKQIALNSEEKTVAKKELLNKGIHLITFSYSKFGLLSLLKSGWAILYLFFLIPLRDIRFIHSWGTPAGSLGYLLSLLTGKTLIIDSYEPHAEAMVENQTWAAGGMKFKLLFYLEKKLSHRAKYIISATEGMREYALLKYNINLTNFFVKPACVDLIMFSPSKRKNKSLIKELQLEDKIVCVYAGKFGGIYLTEEVFRFLHFAEKKWGDKFRVMLLTSFDKDELEGWARKNDFSPDKMIIRFVQHKDIADYMGLADFALTPVKPIPTKKYCTPIKDGEYWALGLPVVITKDISDDSEIIRKNKIGAIIEELNDFSYSKAVNEISEVISGNLQNNIRAIAEKYRSFEIADRIYESIYTEGSESKSDE